MEKSAQSLNKAIIFTGPSGGGKTTLSQHTLDEFPNVERSISVTTRAPRKGEVDGVDYHYIDVETFKRHIENGDFVEWEQVYEGLYYGTLKSEVERIWKSGKVVLFVVDVIGANSLKEYFKEKALKIFVKAPSMEVLENRLLARGSESIESVTKRLSKASRELEHEIFSEEVIINDLLEDSKNRTHQIVGAFLASI